LALIGALLLKIPGITTIRWWGIPFFLSQFIWINLSLLIFNLVPLAPLDGKKWSNISYRTVCFLPGKCTAIRNANFIDLFLILPYLNIDVFGKILSPLISGLYFGWSEDKTMIQIAIIGLGEIGTRWDSL
jgi:hypothetical protein